MIKQTHNLHHQSKPLKKKRKKIEAKFISPETNMKSIQQMH